MADPFFASQPLTMFICGDDDEAKGKVASFAKEIGLDAFITGPLYHARYFEAMAAELRSDGRPRIPSGQHAVKVLPDMGGLSRDGKVPEWRLKIDGEVENPLTLNISDLMRLKQVTQTCDVHCVTGWTLLDSRWHGIPMKAIMELVKVKDGASFVIFEAPGNYSSSIPISEASKNNVLLAHGLFDQKLPQAHGAPLRVLVPDRYFYKSVKWVQRIKFSVADEP